jgi:hypothetical protein
VVSDWSRPGLPPFGCMRRRVHLPDVEGCGPLLIAPSRLSTDHSRMSRLLRMPPCGVTDGSVGIGRPSTAVGTGDYKEGGRFDV